MGTSFSVSEGFGVKSVVFRAMLILSNTSSIPSCFLVAAWALMLDKVREGVDRIGPKISFPPAIVPKVFWVLCVGHSLAQSIFEVVTIEQHPAKVTSRVLLVT